MVEVASCLGYRWWPRPPPWRPLGWWGLIPGGWRCRAEVAASGGLSRKQKKSCEADLPLAAHLILEKKRGVQLKFSSVATMLPSLANSGNFLESIYLAAVAAAVDVMCPVKWTQSPVKKRMRDALGELHPCQIEGRHRCWPEKHKKFVNVMIVTISPKT